MFEKFIIVFEKCLKNISLKVGRSMNIMFLETFFLNKKKFQILKNVFFVEVVFNKIKMMKNSVINQGGPPKGMIMQNIMRKLMIYQGSTS